MEHAATRLDPGPMRMAANDDFDPARNRIELQCLDVVQEMDAALAERDRQALRITLRPPAGIDVPSDRNDRRNELQSVDYIRRTDIAGMDDLRDACQLLLGLRTQQPVGVGDDSYSDQGVGILGAPQADPRDLTPSWADAAAAIEAIMEKLEMSRPPRSRNRQLRTGRDVHPPGEHHDFVPAARHSRHLTSQACRQPTGI